MKRKTTTEVVLKAMARSGPELRPDQIRLADEAQTDKNKVYTQSDLNQSGGGGTGGGGGGPAPDLSGYATTEQLNSEADARDTGDKANLSLIQAVTGTATQNKQDIAAISNDYTTTDEFNTLNGRISQNKKDIASLGEAFDTAVIAAQEGAENLEIELQSYAKKEDIPEGSDLSAYAKKTDIPTDNASLTNGAGYITADDIPDAPEAPDAPDLSGYAKLNGADFTGDIKTKKGAKIKLQDGKDTETIRLDPSGGTVSATEFVGDGSKLTGLPESETPTLDQVCKKGGITTETIGAEKYIAGQDFRNGDPGDAGVEVDGEKGIVHIKGTNNTVTPIEVFQSGSNVHNVGSTVFKVDNHGVCTAEEFVGDGSKLTNLPAGGAASGINEVLAEGDTADPGQSLHFRVNEGHVIPFNREIINVEGGSGLRLGGVVSYYTINEPFTINNEDGSTTEFAFANRRISAADDYYYGEHPKGGSRSASFGINGVSWGSDLSSIDIEHGYVKIGCGPWDNPSLSIAANREDSTITATEFFGKFIGDGSELTNLPGGTAAPVLPGQKWNFVTAHDLPPAPGEMMWVEGDKCLYCHATTADGTVLGSASTSFGQYDVNGTMVVSMYKHAVGIEAVFKAGLVEMITQGGQTFWKILKMNHARFNLNEGTAYNVTASGLF